MTAPARPAPAPLTPRAAIIRLKRLLNDLDDLIVELERDEAPGDRPVPRPEAVH